MLRTTVALVAALLPATALAQQTSIPPAGPVAMSGPAFRLHPAWGRLAYTNPEFASSPRDHGGCTADPARRTVFCGVKSGSVLALSTGEGTLLWDFRTHGSVPTHPAVDGDAVYAGSSDGCLYKLDEATGKPLWKEPYCTDAAVYGSPTVDGGTVYFSVSINKVYAVSAADGTFRWEYHRDRPQFMSAEGVSAPTVTADRVYVGFSDGALVALDRADGRLLWSADVTGGKSQTDVDTTPLVDEDRVYAGSFGEGISAVKAADGTVLWRDRFFGATRPVQWRDLLIFGTADGEVVAVNRSDGHVRWLLKLLKTAAWAPVLVGDVGVVGGDWGLTSFDASTGAPMELLAIPAGVVATPGVSGNRLFFPAGGGTVNAMDVIAR